MDPTYVQPAPIPAPLVVLPAYPAPIKQPPNAVESAPAPSSFRIFTSPDGMTIQAEILGFTKSKVTLRRADGQIITTELYRFSAEDEAYLRDLRTRRAPMPKP